MDGSPAATWAGRRERGQVLHVDTAACGRTSRAVRERIAAHMEAEARSGGYVAEAAAAEVLLQARTDLGSMLRFDARDVAFVESGSAAFAQLLASWPLQIGDVVWVAPSEWGPNLAALDDHQLKVEFLDVDVEGVVEMDALMRRLTQQRPAMVHLTALAAHRALAQPVADVVRACSGFEVPVVVDAAQALGHHPFAGDGVAAAHGTCRKYLCGPRGVGYLAVRDPWQNALVPRAPALRASRWAGETRPARRLESREASIAGRLGVATALREYLDLGADPIMTRLREVGNALRIALADLTGWRLRDDLAAPGAIVSLTAEGIDVQKARTALLDRGVLTTAAYPERAPYDMTGPLLRLSPHIDLTTSDIEYIVRLLHDATRGL